LAAAARDLLETPTTHERKSALEAGESKRGALVGLDRAIIAAASHPSSFSSWSGNVIRDR
jgi:hypothetical protein